MCVEANESIEDLFCIELAQRRLPPQSGPWSIKYLLCFNISVISCILIVYCRSFSTSGIRALSLAQAGNFLSFLKKKGAKLGGNFHIHFWNFLCRFKRNKLHIWIPLSKICSFKREKHLIWSSKSEDIADLKSAIFQNFGDGRGYCRAKSFWLDA